MTLKSSRFILIGLVLVIVAAGGYWQFVERIGNPRVVRELIENPDGERARRVLLLTLPSGRQIPVNYIREQEMVYVAADGGWWSELTEAAHSVSVLVRGETLSGMARTILDDPETIEDVFSRLRPNAIEGFGTLVEIQLQPAEPSAP